MVHGLKADGKITLKMFVLFSKVNEKTKRHQGVGTGCRASKASKAFSVMGGKRALGKYGLKFKKYQD